MGDHWSMPPGWFATTGSPWPGDEIRTVHLRRDELDKGLLASGRRSRTERAGVPQARAKPRCCIPAFSASPPRDWWPSGHLPCRQAVTVEGTTGALALHATVQRFRRRND